jgi:hypothetical protein
MSEQRVFTVTYSDGEQVLVKAVSWKKLEEVRLLCYEILKEVAEKEGEITEIITPSNKVFWGHAKKLAKLLPIVGSEEKLNLDRIDDIDQIIDIFVCSISSIDYTTGALKTMDPSQICRIHSINFHKLLQKVLNELEEQ